MSTEEMQGEAVETTEGPDFFSGSDEEFLENSGSLLESADPSYEPPEALQTPAPPEL